MPFDINEVMRSIYVCAVCIYILAIVFSFLFTINVIGRRENYDLDNVFGFVLCFVGFLPAILVIIFCVTAISISIMTHTALGYLP